MLSTNTHIMHKIACLLFLFLASCQSSPPMKHPESMRVEVSNPQLIRCVQLFKEKMQSTLGTSDRLIRIFYLSQTCNGPEVLLESAPKRLSAVMSPPMDNYVLIDGSLVLVTTGLPLVQYDTKAYQERVLRDFPIDSVDRDWEGPESEPGYTYDPIYARYLLSDSIMELPVVLDSLYFCLHHLPPPGKAISVE